MWLTLFSITLAAAIAFTVAAIMLQPKRIAIVGPLNDRRSSSSELLLDRMKSLDLNPADISSSDPALFRQLEARCWDCENKDRCERELTHNSEGEKSGGWRDYCPNGPMLDLLHTLQGCHFDLRTPASPGAN